MPAADEAEQPALRLENVAASYGRTEVLHSVSLSLAAHECLALVGESGSGKTTIARAIAGLHRNWTGTIALGGTELQHAARQRSSEARRQIQYIFQNPYGSLNPRQTIGQIVGQPLRVFGIASGREADRRIAEMLERVSLTAAYARRYPDQLSGGERQRVAIARALVCDPTRADLRRGHLGARRQRAGRDRRAARQPAARPRAVDALHHPQPAAGAVDRAARRRAEPRATSSSTATPRQVLADPQQPYTRQLLSDTPSLETAASEAGVGEPPARRRRGSAHDARWPTARTS